MLTTSFLKTGTTNKQVKQTCFDKDSLKIIHTEKNIDKDP